jgi:hypothetical protein
MGGERASTTRMPAVREDLLPVRRDATSSLFARRAAVWRLPTRAFVPNTIVPCPFLLPPVAVLRNPKGRTTLVRPHEFRGGLSLIEMSDVTRNRRAAKGRCVDCGPKIEAAAYRCRDCAVDHAGEMRRSRYEKGAVGICPACGKNPLQYGLSGVSSASSRSGKKKRRRTWWNCSSATRGRGARWSRAASPLIGSYRRHRSRNRGLTKPTCRFTLITAVDRVSKILVRNP